MLKFYRRFIPNVAQTQAILHDFLKNAKNYDNRMVNWTDEAISACEKYIKHVSGTDNVIADTLSRITDICLTNANLEDIAKAQQDDQELQNLLAHSSSSHQLQKMEVQPNFFLNCDVSNNLMRQYAPVNYRNIIFDSLHGLSHPEGYRYLLICIDSYTRWPEVIPISDISAETDAKCFVTNWIACFGVPAVITNEQGRQFMSKLFADLNSMLGIKRIRTTPYHAMVNGRIKRLHRTSKQGIICHNKLRWTETLPIVLLGIRSAFKDDLRGSCSEMVCGTGFSLPGQFFNHSTKPIEESIFIEHSWETMEKLTPVPDSDQSRQTCRVHPALKDSTHVFIRKDWVKPPLVKKSRYK
ncbi:uncharacterized protein [Parasteatoda tepidariorum]|uniref:uncharacterized protein n=1 Tax=Parasteatoda tepidariorum TaxID=114398 RepID=UPI0039BCE77C